VSTFKEFLHNYKALKTGLSKGGGIERFDESLRNVKKAPILDY